MRSKPFRLLTAILLLAPLAVPALAEVRPLGQEFRVNRTNDFQQKNPVAAFAESGAALVVWENDQTGIRGAFRRPDGRVVSAQLSLAPNDGLLPGQYEGIVVSRKDPAVAFLPGGHFLLAWTEERASLRTSAFFEDRQVQDQDVVIQRFDANGAPAGRRFRVNASVAGFQAVPKLAVLPNGTAFVLWKSSGLVPPQGGIVGRLVNASGQPTGSEIKVIEDATADHGAVAAGRNGFLVVWDATVDGTQDVFARLYRASGLPDGTEFRVHSAVAGQQRWPAVAAGTNGDYLVAWQSYLTDRSLVRIFGQFVGREGNLLGGSFMISTDEGTGQLAPALAPAKAGGFVAAWLDWSDIGLGINSVQIDATGSRVGDELWIATTGVLKNYRTSIATDAKGNYLMPWQTFARRRQVINARGLAE